MDSFSAKFAKFLKHHENISIYLNWCSCSSGITSTPQTCCVERTEGCYHQHTPKPWINAALKLSLVGYVTVDMFYTPPLFKASNAFFQKNSKKQKKIPRIFWLSHLFEGPTWSAPPKMMNWRLLYDSSWPWAHQQLSQWSLEACRLFLSHFLVEEKSVKSMGLPQSIKRVVFFWGGGFTKI